MDRRQAVINEYLFGYSSFRELGKKHGVGPTTVHRWVRESQGLSKPYMRGLKSVISADMKKSTVKEDLPQDVAALQKELVQERLRNKLLTAMINIAEEQLKIPIRKKYGTRQLKK